MKMLTFPVFWVFLTTSILLFVFRTRSVTSAFSSVSCSISRSISLICMREEFLRLYRLESLISPQVDFEIASHRSVSI